MTAAEQGLVWVKLHTTITTDDDFLDLSSDAKVVALMSLARSGRDSSFGRVRRNPRAIGRYTGLTEPEVEAAVAELLAMGWFAEDGHALLVRNWDKYQMTVDERADLRAKRQQAGSRGGKKRAENAAAARQAEALAAPDDEAPTTLVRLTASTLADQLTAALSQIVPQVFDTYGVDAAAEQLPIQIGEAIDGLVAKHGTKVKSKDLASYLWGQACGWVAVEQWQEPSKESFAVKQGQTARGRAFGALIAATPLSADARVGRVVNLVKGGVK